MHKPPLDITKLHKGDEAAYASLIKIYQDKIYATCYKFFLNKEDAHDLTQEVFIEIFESIGYFKEEAELSTWIFRITTNKCLDELKRRSRKKRIAYVVSLMGMEHLSNKLIHETHPERLLIVKDELRKVLTALDQLNDRQRVAYTLSKIEGYSTKEIANIMELSESATEALIKRGKQNLLAILEKRS